MRTEGEQEAERLWRIYAKARKKAQKAFDEIERKAWEEYEAAIRAKVARSKE